MTWSFDSTEDPYLLPFSAWKWMRDHYWVCAFRVESSDFYSVAPWDWLLSDEEPLAVPNSQMHWRRPTYAEALRRWQFQREQPDDFIRLREDYSLEKYRPRSRLSLDGLRVPLSGQTMENSY